MVEIATSLLSIKKEESVQTIYNLEVAGTNYFHIDVMDGKFVKNDTTEIMRQYTETIKQISSIPIEVHLMVKDVEAYSKAYIDMQVNTIIFHIESIKSEKEIMKLLSYIKQNNLKVGLSLSPNTEIEKLEPYLPYIHRVLIMSVEPGEGGQKFIEKSVERIKRLSRFIYENGYDIDIEVDGGINDVTAKEVIDAGANILVVGSYIINSKDYKETMQKLR